MIFRPTEAKRFSAGRCPKPRTEFRGNVSRQTPKEALGDQVDEGPKRPRLHQFQARSPPVLRRCDDRGLAHGFPISLATKKVVRERDIERGNRQSGHPVSGITIVVFHATAHLEHGPLAVVVALPGLGGVILAHLPGVFPVPTQESAKGLLQAVQVVLEMVG
jgi:hypothetical protein